MVTLAAPAFGLRLPRFEMINRELMASLFNMPRPRGQGQRQPARQVATSLMTDSSFQGMGRAPVDELFAGDLPRFKTQAGMLEAERIVRLYFAGGERLTCPPSQQRVTGRPLGGLRPQLWTPQRAILNRRIRAAVTDATSWRSISTLSKATLTTSFSCREPPDDSGATLVDGWRDGML